MISRLNNPAYVSLCQRFADCRSRDFTPAGWLCAPALRVVVAAVGLVLSCGNVEARSPGGQLGLGHGALFPGSSRSLNVAGERWGGTRAGDVYSP